MPPVFRWLRFIVASFVLIITACSEPKLAPLSSDATIVAFGDSLTYGIGAGSQNYPNSLAAITGLNVVNAGISGETTAGGVQRFQAVIEQHRPELIILLEGGNDILRNHNRLTTKQNLSRMIQMAQSENIALILIGVPEKSLFSDSAEIYEQLADEFQLVFDGEILADLLRTNQYKSDAIHLNAKGYHKLAERIYALMQENGAIL